MSERLSALAFDVSTHPRKLIRAGFGEALLELGERNPNVVALSADLACVTGVKEFAQKFPDRAFNVGIAEQNLVGIAAGLASCGLVPFATTYAPFLTLRALEQIRDDVAYTKFNVKMAAACTGISYGPGGSTHHSTEDIALMRSLPNMTVLVPADARECYKATLAAADQPGPVYIRMGAPRAEDFVVYREDYDYRIGKSVRLREGEDVTIIATGVLVFHAMLASDLLRQEGLGVRVVNMHTIKPIDRAEIIAAARDTGRIVTAEEHSVIGGLGGAVAEVVVQECPVPMRMVAIPDIFASIGPTLQLYAKYGLTWDGIARVAREFVRR